MFQSRAGANAVLPCIKVTGNIHSIQLSLYPTIQELRWNRWRAAGLACAVSRSSCVIHANALTRRCVRSFMGTLSKRNDQYPEQEAQQRLEKLVRSALNTKPKPRESMAPRGVSAQSKKLQQRQKKSKASR